MDPCLRYYRDNSGTKPHAASACNTCKRIRDLERDLPSSNPEGIESIMRCRTLPQELADLVQDFTFAAAFHDLQGEHIITAPTRPPALLSLQPWDGTAIARYYGPGSTFIFHQESHLAAWLRSVPYRHRDRVGGIRLVYHDRCPAPHLQDGIDSRKQVAIDFAKRSRETLHWKLHHEEHIDDADAYYVVNFILVIEVLLDFGDDGEPIRGVDVPPGDGIRD